ncbi:MAG: hypothetical protein C0482_20370 [Gordonia sp.]|nr:hypothetical protein [Gordonia sp. (in: high G+C Gram-positive bacteria)]
MKHVVTGIGEDGKSFLESVSIYDDPTTGPTTISLFENSAVPLLARPVSGDLLEIAPEPGTVTWRIFAFHPGRATPFHHTDSIDISTVVDGTVEFAVDTESIALEAGDVVVVNGAGHSWNTELGCRLLVGMVGGNRPAAE